MPLKSIKVHVILVFFIFVFALHLKHCFFEVRGNVNVFLWLDI